MTDLMRLWEIAKSQGNHEAANMIAETIKHFL